MSERTEEQIMAALEAILFSMGESVELEKLALAVELPQKQTKELLDRMKEAYQAPERGIKLLELEGAYQLVTKQEYYDTLVTIAMHPKKPVLTDVIMETLSIVAYRQPVTRSEVEAIRGVKCDHAINKLIEYDLICEVGRLDAPGRPILFGTTETFLRSFGIETTEALPEINPVKLEDFKAEAEAEIPVTV